ncbi:hypothetical protein FGSG_13155 [Fusarium graminearum PH-1]|uniref:Chromosome 4, complete genome n=1 Tax=Gibberella zeae (strain ATCC MYA-4620 / CBS 123657 / FGSC 9075 / NRRL 31084 / PH-1) TaxID=229533 RepID=I1S8H7_GIBZE|nr:hypothetical protein FGSG_13155 [Fusarium graminearum PH-1]ESU13750.1 hypothetical protein FGSG_13155 [Fusarium graminearum PH-1]CEF84235.1 unnamed protein product [Fusarium graminearum]|eukprot:XP_011327257.1 hypothetical protein FGSG_13155 [Fusarium graminearum PH-1]
MIVAHVSPVMSVPRLRVRDLRRHCTYQGYTTTRARDLHMSELQVVGPSAEGCDIPCQVDELSKPCQTRGVSCTVPILIHCVQDLRLSERDLQQGCTHCLFNDVIDVHLREECKKANSGLR